MKQSDGVTSRTAVTMTESDVFLIRSIWNTAWKLQYHLR